MGESFSHIFLPAVGVNGSTERNRMNLTVAGVVCVSVCRSCVDFVWCCVAVALVCACVLCEQDSLVTF